jgi:SnoaL-like domain
MGAVAWINREIYSSRRSKLENKGEKMNTQEVALRLVELCRKGEYMQAIDSLYGKDIVSVEPRAMENMPAEMRGIDQVRGKTHWWIANHEIHDSKVSGPFVAGDKFVVQFDIDVTDKASKQRMQMSEVGIYTVKDDKIAREEFLPVAGEES